jgi:hypothetical protein
MEEGEPDEAGMSAPRQRKNQHAGVTVQFGAHDDAPPVSDLFLTSFSWFPPSTTPSSGQAEAGQLAASSPTAIAPMMRNAYASSYLPQRTPPFSYMSWQPPMVHGDFQQKHVPHTLSSATQTSSAGTDQQQDVPAASCGLNQPRQDIKHSTTYAQSLTRQGFLQTSDLGKKEGSPSSQPGTATTHGAYEPSGGAHVAESRARKPSEIGPFYSAQESAAAAFPNVKHKHGNEQPTSQQLLESENCGHFAVQARDLARLSGGRSLVAYAQMPPFLSASPLGHLHAQTEQHMHVHDQYPLHIRTTRPSFDQDNQLAPRHKDVSRSANEMQTPKSSSSDVSPPKDVELIDEQWLHEHHKLSARSHR